MSGRLTLAWSEAAIHYFAERAIDPDLAAKLGVRENGHGLEFPYPHGMGERFARTRSLNGGGPKVHQPSGTTLVPWQPVPNGEAREVLVTEGESDALAAISALRHSPLEEFRNLPVLAIPGTGCPVKRVVEHLASTECQQAWVALDADDAGMAYTEKLISLLGEKGIRICRVDFAEGFDLANSLAAVAENERGGWIANALLDAQAAAEKKPPPAESAEHTEHPGEKPLQERDRVFGLRGEHSTEHAPNTLAREDQILDQHDKLMADQGLIGERHISRATYLVHISRLLAEPAREVIKGDSATGKSFAAECSLNAAAPEELYVRTSTSPLALFYSEGDFRHRTLVFYEANKLGDDDDELARVLRTLISEGRLAHEVTIPEKRKTTLLEKQGPVAFISTTCKPSLDKEIETRIVSFHSDNSDQQTSDVVRAILESAANPPEDPNLPNWHDLDRWLAAWGPYEVVVPWAPSLAQFELSGPPRLRRDITNLLALCRAHAVLHRATREVDECERIVATLADYDVVRDILATALAVATDKAVRKGTRAIVEAVTALRQENKERVSMRAASRKAGRSPSTTHTDVHDALERGYLVNRSQRDNHYDLDLGDDLPEPEDLLPATLELARVFAQCSVPDRTRKPAFQSEKPLSVRSVRSNPERTDWTGEAAADFIAKATTLFPGSVEEEISMDAEQWARGDA